jgi:sigma-B regulation protein RsbU (phosphoserine phosphatase)
LPEAPLAATARRRRILLAVVLLVAASYQVRYSWDTLRLAFAPQTVPQRPFAVGVSGTLRDLQPAAEEAGLRRGDVLASVDGREFRGRSTFPRALAGKPIGSFLDVVVRRQGTEVRARVPVVAESHQLGARAQPVILVLVGVLTPILCFSLGAFVAFMRPLDARAWLLLLLMLSFARLVIADAVDPAGWETVAFRGLALAYNGLMRLTWPLALFLFGVAFPERLEWDRRRPWIKWAVVAPMVFFAVTLALQEAIGADHAHLADVLSPPLVAMAPMVPYYFFGVIGAFFAMIGSKRWKATSPDAHRRLSLLIWGSGVSLTPVGLLALYTLLTGARMQDVPLPLVVSTFVLLSLFPLTLAYVIVVHRALDVRVVVRQGLQYALASKGIVILQVLVTFGVILWGVSMAADPGANRPRRIMFMALAVTAVFLLQGASERIRAFVDRRFFREAYDAEQLLTHLGDDVRTIVDPQDLLATVTRRVADTLHVNGVAALVHQGGRYVAACGAGLDPLPEASLAGFSPVAERLRLTGKPLRLDWSEAGSWAARHVPPAEAEALQALRCEVLLPMSSRDKLLGMLSLGPRLSEQPWAPGELRLLQTVAAQAAVALENAQLTAAMASEVARRERMNREIEIAREVQEGLFPQHLPRIPLLELAGMCRPALGVGGDYYDFLELPGQKLGLAVGDVSGKGIPASLLMSALRAGLRTQTSFGAADVATLMERLNQLIYESSPPNRYITFFYGQYDPATRQLVYVNAGHLPPMLFRAGLEKPLRLEAGGPVIGLLPVAPYTAGSVELRAGDLLVAYSDGVSEAMNVDDEEYGEERLAYAVRAVIEEAAAPVVARVLESVDAFVGAARQHDDITLVALRAS